MKAVDTTSDPVERAARIIAAKIDPLHDWDDLSLWRRQVHLDAARLVLDDVAAHALTDDEMRRLRAEVIDLRADFGAVVGTQAHERAEDRPVTLAVFACAVLFGVAGLAGVAVVILLGEWRRD